MAHVLDLAVKRSVLGFRVYGLGFRGMLVERRSE